MKDLGYNECHKCSGNIETVKETSKLINERLQSLVKVTVPVWKCKECKNVVHPKESFEIIKRASGPNEVKVS